MNLIDAARDAIENLQSMSGLLRRYYSLHDNEIANANDCIAALRTAIADAERCEPVAWMRRWAFDGETPSKTRNEKGRLVWGKKFKFMAVSETRIFNDDVPLYTHPPMLSDAAVEQPAQHDYWQEEARRYAENADYWRGKYEAAIAQSQITDAAVERAVLGIANAHQAQLGLPPVEHISRIEKPEYLFTVARAALAAAWEAK